MDDDIAIELGKRAARAYLLPPKKKSRRSRTVAVNEATDALQTEHTNRQEPWRYGQRRTRTS